jgi:hypothetical protein
MALIPSTGLCKIKKVIRTEAFLCYPDFNKPVLFHLYIDASDHQLGSVIMQDKKPIAFYLQKLNTAQRRYTTTERKRELLSAIERCKKYKNIRLGYPIIVFIDHKDNTFNGLKASDHVLRWLLLLQEYGVTFEYLPGKRQKNVPSVADSLSRFDIDSLKIQKETEEESLTLLSGSDSSSISNIKLTIPMHTALIFKEQAKVKEQVLREKGLAQPHYSIQHIEGYDLLCYKDNTQDLHSSVIETKSTVQVPWIFTSSGTDKNRKDFQEYHGMAWSYTRCWTLIVHVPIVKYVKWQRRSVRNVW